MKITIKNGVSVQKAIGYISCFLRENYSDYTQFEGELSLDITLKDEEDKKCPDNLEEYVLSADCITDAGENEISIAKAKTFRCLNETLKHSELALNKEFEKIFSDENNERRRQELYERSKLLERLAESIREGNAKWHITTWNMSNKTPCTQTIDACLIIRDISGFTGYFEVIEFGGRSFGFINRGLPPSYSES